MECALIIINYRTPNLVIDAITSLAEQVEPDRWQVVVVDNCSGDDSVAILLESLQKNQWGKWVEIIQAPYNGGFSYGNNFGIKHIQADNYLLLNSDTIVRPGAIHELLSAKKKKSWADIIIPKLEWPDGSPQENQFLYRTPCNEFLRSASTGFLEKLFELVGLHGVVIPSEKKGQEPEWVSFACVLISKKVIDKIGYLDSSYFMYLEDMDYCRHANDAGIKIHCCEKARVVHLNYGLSNSEPRRRLPGFYYASRARYFVKFYGHSGLFAANLFWLLGLTISLIRRIGGRELPVPEYAWLDIWKNVLSPMKTDKLNDDTNE